MPHYGGMMSNYEICAAELIYQIRMMERSNFDKQLVSVVICLGETTCLFVQNHLKFNKLAIVTIIKNMTNNTYYTMHV